MTRICARATSPINRQPYMVVGFEFYHSLFGLIVVFYIAPMGPTAYPAGGTWFDQLKKSFADVPVDSSRDNAIETTAFLEAAESLTTLFGAFFLPYYLTHLISIVSRRLRLYRLHPGQKRHDGQY